MILRPASVAILAAASVAAVAAQGAIRPEWVAAVHVAPRLPATDEAEVPADDGPGMNDEQDSSVEEDEDGADADDGEGDADGESARSWTTTLSLRSGYDSNYDEDDPARGSGFVEGAAGIFGTARIGDFDTEFEADATYLRAPGVSVSRVTDATVAASATRRWSETVSGMLGGSAEIDFEEDPAAFTAEAHAEIAHSTDEGRVALRGGVERVRPWRARAVLSEDGDDYQPKYWAALLRIEADGPAKAALAPYGRLELARLRHDRRRSVRIDDADFIPGPSRDGWRTRMSGGLAWRPVESLTFRGGLALARRSFDGGGWRTAHFVSPEFSAEWSPAEDMRLSLSYERAFGESDEFDALAEDVSTAAFGFAYEPDAGFGFSAEASRERSRRIGDGADATEYAAELVASYRVSDHLTLEGGVELAASFDDDGSEEYRRARAFIGATAEY